LFIFSIILCCQCCDE